MMSEQASQTRTTSATFDRTRTRTRLRDELRLVESALDTAAAQLRRKRVSSLAWTLAEVAITLLAVVGLTMFALLSVGTVSSLVTLLVLVATTGGLAVLVPFAAWLFAGRQGPDRVTLARELDDKLGLNGALLTAACEPRTGSSLHNRFLGRVRQTADHRLTESPKLPALGPPMREWVAGYASVILLVLALALLFTNRTFRDDTMGFFDGGPQQPIASHPDSDGDPEAGQDTDVDPPPPANGGAEGEPDDQSPDEQPAASEDDAESEDGEGGDGDDEGEGEGESSRTGGTGDGENDDQQSQNSGSGGESDSDSADQPQDQSDNEQAGGDDEQQPEPTGGGEEVGDPGPPPDPADWELDPTEVQLEGGEGEREPGTIRVYSGNDQQPGAEEIPLTDLLPRLSPARQAGRMAGQRHADDERLIREYYRLLEQLAGKRRSGNGNGNGNGNGR